MFRRQRFLFVKSASLLVLLLFFTVGTAMARVAVVTTKDGRSLEGQLIHEDDKQIVLEIAGISTPIARPDIAKVEFRKDIADEYKERRAKLEDSDLDGRYALAYYLYEQKAFSLAKQELDSLTVAFPDSEEAARLHKVVVARLKLKEEPPSAGRDTRPTQPDRPTPQKVDREDLLNEEQVNLIRVYEINLDAERPPAINIPKNIWDDVFTRYASEGIVPKGRVEQRRFRAKPGHEQLELLFALQAREFYKDVQIRRDPPKLAAFRKSVNPVYVAGYFREHFGTGQIPGLTLFGQRPNETIEAYTNFYILSEFEYNGRPLIDRDRPEESLLVQWGMRRADAKYPAPDVPGWRPFFNNREHRTYGLLIDWIGTLYRPKPDYGLNYRWPGYEAAKKAAPDDAGAGGQE